MVIHTDVLVIGSGIAGLFYTLKVADRRKVVLVTKKQTVESNTNYAQGGIASVMDPGDSFELHVEDTLAAGAGLCRRPVVEAVVHEGPQLVRELRDLGARFTEHGNELDLGREGGHSRNRIVHASDLTGREIERSLSLRVRAHPNVTVLENHVALELITQHNLRSRSAAVSGRIVCAGAYVLDKEQRVVKTALAGTTVLASGGCGTVYLHTTNPPIATGDGVAMAFRAGAEIANMEFIQFHPTALAHGEGRSFLVSEAVRGFGAFLVTSDGRRFMDRYDARAELAPRDIVARAIDAELKKRGDDCVYLDLRHLDPDRVRRTFPNIAERCRAENIDLATNLVPVVPAAHYSCGGVRVDSNGRTTVDRLFACGEVSMTGVHGANRLASNSLLEALVFANRAAASTCDTPPERPSPDDYLPWDSGGTFNAEEWILIAHNRRELQTLMWDYVGIVRSNLRLARAARRLTMLLDEVEQYYKGTRVTEHLVELRNLTLVAHLIVVSARLRHESRGLHFNTDYPQPDASLAAHDTRILAAEDGRAAPVPPVVGASDEGIV